MNKILQIIYVLLFIISVILFIAKWKELDKYKGWFYKSILLILTGIFMTISLYYNSKIINEKIGPILLYLNLLILIYIVIRNKQNKQNNIEYIAIIGILYLLYTFKFKKFKIFKGKLINPDVRWIYNHIIILILYYILTNNKTISFRSKIGLISLVLYPLLFPLNEYFIHRIYSLCFVAFSNYAIIL